MVESKAAQRGSIMASNIKRHAIKSRETGAEISVSFDQKHKIPLENGIHLSGIKSFKNLEELKQLIEEEFGTIVKCQIPVNKATGLPLGYGTIFFENRRSAEIALKRAEPFVVNGQAIRFEYYKEKEQRVRETQEKFTNLYINNIRGSFKDEEEFLNLFRRIGPLKSSKIERYENGKWKGYGFIDFEKTEDAQFAVHHLHGYLLRNGTRLHVAKYESKNDRLNKPKNETNLSNCRSHSPKFKSEWDSSDADSESDWEDNNVKNWSLASSKDSLGSRKTERKLDPDEPEEQEDFYYSANSSYTFSSRPSSETSDSEDSSSGLGTTICKNENKPFRNLYVKNFNGIIKNEKDLRGMFKIFGNILSARIAGKNFGYVCFVDTRHAAVAVQSLHGIRLNNGKELHVSEAISKRERENKMLKIHRSVETIYKNYLGSREPIVNTKQICPICSEKCEPENMVELKCQHSHCKQCLTDFLTFFIENHEIQAIHCAYKNCGQELEPNLIRALVGKKTFIIYDNILLANLLNSMNDIVFCEKCQFPICIDLDCPSTMLNCKKCDWWCRFSSELRDSNSVKTT